MYSENSVLRKQCAQETVYSGNSVHRHHWKSDINWHSIHNLSSNSILGVCKITPIYIKKKLRQLLQLHTSGTFFGTWPSPTAETSDQEEETSDQEEETSDQEEEICIKKETSDQEEDTSDQEEAISDQEEETSDQEEKTSDQEEETSDPVSYTHLTLPTRRTV